MQILNATKAASTFGKIMKNKNNKNEYNLDNLILVCFVIILNAAWVLQYVVLKDEHQSWLLDRARISLLINRRE